MNKRSPSVASDLQELDLLERRLGLQAVPPTEISSLTRMLAGAKSRIALKAINNILKNYTILPAASAATWAEMSDVKSALLEYQARSCILNSL